MYLVRPENDKDEKHETGDTTHKRTRNNSKATTKKERDGVARSEVSEQTKLQGHMKHVHVYTPGLFSAVDFFAASDFCERKKQRTYYTTRHDMIRYFLFMIHMGDFFLPENKTSSKKKKGTLISLPSLIVDELLINIAKITRQHKTTHTYWHALWTKFTTSGNAGEQKIKKK